MDMAIVIEKAFSPHIGYPGSHGEVPYLRAYLYSIVAIIPLALIRIIYGPELKPRISLMRKPKGAPETLALKNLISG
jgi:hypothetical protein